MLIDSHCHLDFKDFSDLDKVINDAKKAGVEKLLTIGVSKKDFPKVISVSEKYDNVFFALAVHPHEAEKEGEEITTEELIELSSHKKCVAIGETGLDYFYEHSPRDAQQRNFRNHIRACIKTNLPLIIHTRDAEEDTIRILSEEIKGNEGKLKGVLHCFSSKREMAEYGLEIGFYISFSGMITFNKSDNIREIAKDIPMDRLLVETDAPFLAPVPFRGKRCEPAHVVETAKHLAKVKNVSFEEIEKITTENFYKLFTKVNRGL